MRRWYARCPQAPAFAHASVTERTERRTPRAMETRMMPELGETFHAVAAYISLLFWFWKECSNFSVCPSLSSVQE